MRLYFVGKGSLFGLLVDKEHDLQTRSTTRSPSLKSLRHQNDGNSMLNQHSGHVIMTLKNPQGSRKWNEKGFTPFNLGHSIYPIM